VGDSSWKTNRSLTSVFFPELGNSSPETSWSWYQCVRRDGCPLGPTNPTSSSGGPVNLLRPTQYVLEGRANARFRRGDVASALSSEAAKTGLVVRNPWGTNFARGGFWRARHGSSFTLPFIAFLKEKQFRKTQT